MISSGERHSDGRSNLARRGPPAGAVRPDEKRLRPFGAVGDRGGKGAA